MKLHQLLLCCALSIMSMFAWFGLAALAAVSIFGPEDGDGETASAVFAFCLPGCVLWIVVLYFTTTFFERRNERR